MMESRENRERIVYNKIVRDNIPEIVKADGKQAEIETVDQTEALWLLKQKLIEEAQEASGESDAEALTGELADLMEVIRAIANQANIKMEDIETARVAKLNERGGFDKRIKLISTF